MPLRVRQMTDSAEKLAEVLAGHPKLNQVIYPHHPSHPQYDLAKSQMTRGSSLIALDVKGGQEAAFALSDSLAVILISNNLGDAKSLITHPRTTTHARLSEDARLEVGVTPGLLRLSVGLEASDDLIADLLYGLDQI
jgi:O-succinylhomoserine sulfhydrylase